MKRFNLLFIKILIFSMLFLLLAAMPFFNLINLINFPDKIRLIKGSSQNLNFSLPVEAVIEPQSVTALKVNDMPVLENIKINLSKTLTIESDNIGTANMTLSVMGFPVKQVLLDIMPDTEVIACGMTVGVRINTDGVMVLGTGEVESEDGNSYNPSQGILKSGDLIQSVNDQRIYDIDSLKSLVESSGEPAKLAIVRKEEQLTVTVTPVKNKKDSNYKIGIWTRDSTQGIGTVTYYNPSTNKFGALGHGILEVDTKQLMSVREGIIRSSDITSVKKGKKGAPGELSGDITGGRVIGTVTSNSRFGIFGTVSPPDVSRSPSEPIKIGLQNQVREGPAKILCNVEGSEIKDYDVYIETVNRYSSDDSKGMVVRITDPELLRITNGIVQGMSGSPIIQDNRLIGAVTHVFVQDPTKGYGIFIENMINSEI